MNGMVSRRKFISMTMMMVVLLFMFQFAQAVKDMENDYNVNTYDVDYVWNGTNAWQVNEGATEAVTLDDVKEGKYVAYLGSTDNQLGCVIQQWCTYTKRDLVTYNSVNELVEIRRKQPEVLLIDSNYVNFRTEASYFLTLAEKEISMVFCNLPDVDTVKTNEKLRELLGIKSVEAEEVELNGIKLFSGFLLGGESIYQVKQAEDEARQDLDLTVPWYVAFGGTKTYMVGLLDDENVRNEYLPAIIWRNSHKNAKIFAVNGDYLYDSTGIGILDAMMAELHSYEIYPVINAQNLTIANFPGFAEENTAETRRLYSRTQKGLYQDIMWPAITSLSGKTELRQTLFFMPQSNYNDGIEPTDADYIFYLKEIKENEAEAGASLQNRSEGTPLEEKLTRDGSFYDASNEGYVFTAGYVGESANISDMLDKMKNVDAFHRVKTLVYKYDETMPVVAYAEQNPDIILQSASSDGVNYTFLEDLRMRSLQTALGYSNILLDMYEIAWPNDEGDAWEKQYDVFSRNINTFWKPFEKFDKTTVSASDKRARIMLSVNFADRREGDVIYLQVENFNEEAWFILRLHGEKVQQVSGAESTKLEDGAYLLKITNSVVRIQLEPAEGPYYYIPANN